MKENNAELRIKGYIRETNFRYSYSETDLKKIETLSKNPLSPFTIEKYVDPEMEQYYEEGPGSVSFPEYNSLGNTISHVSADNLKRLSDVSKKYKLGDALFYQSKGINEAGFLRFFSTMNDLNLDLVARCSSFGEDQHSKRVFATVLGNQMRYEMYDSSNPEEVKGIENYLFYMNDAFSCIAAAHDSGFSYEQLGTQFYQTISQKVIEMDNFIELRDNNSPELYDIISVQKKNHHKEKSLVEKLMIKYSKD